MNVLDAVVIIIFITQLTDQKLFHYIAYAHSPLIKGDKFRPTATRHS